MADMLGEAYVVIRASMDKVRGDSAKAGDEIKRSLLQSLTGFDLPEGISPKMIAGVGAAALAAAGAYGVFRTAQAEWNENIKEGTKLSEEFSKAEARRRAALEVNSRVGFNVSELREQAKVIDDAVAGSKAKITEAQTQLLAFRNIQGDNFKRATKDAVDLAAAIGSDLPSAAHLLGRSLSDPERGMMHLRRAGVLLTDTQQKLVRQFAAAGQSAKAQEVLLGALENQYGGFAEKAVRPLDRLKSELEDVRRKIGDIMQERKPLLLQVEIAFAHGQLGLEDEVQNLLTPLSKALNTTSDKLINGLIENSARTWVMLQSMFFGPAGPAMILLGRLQRARQKQFADAMPGKDGHGGLAPEPPERETPQGVFTAIQLSNKLDEIYRGDNQRKLLDLTAEGNQIAKDGFSTLAERLKPQNDTIPVARPR